MSEKDLYTEEIEKEEPAEQPEAKAPDTETEAAPEETEATDKKSRKKNRQQAAELEKAQAERDDYKNALIRERADFENFKKRNAIATAKAYNDGKLDAVTEMLPVIDNLERAIASVEGDDDPMKQGVQMVLRQMEDVLKKLEVEEIEAEGKPFDPNFHNAVMQEEAAEGEESGTVKEVLMKGYKAKDRVLRHSMVKVIN